MRYGKVVLRLLPMICYMKEMTLPAFVSLLCTLFALAVSSTTGCFCLAAGTRSTDCVTVLREKQHDPVNSQ